VIKRGEGEEEEELLSLFSPRGMFTGRDVADQI